MGKKWKRILNAKRVAKKKAQNESAVHHKAKHSPSVDYLTPAAEKDPESKPLRPAVEGVPVPEPAAEEAVAEEVVASKPVRKRRSKRRKSTED